MASVVGSATFISIPPRSSLKAINQLHSLKSVSFVNQRKSFPSIRLHPARYRVCCSAKQETVDMIIEIVREQLAIPDETSVNGETKFTALGADSLDTVEIVMGIEEAFDVSVGEESAQSIATVQDAAEMVEMLQASKSA